MATDSLVLGFGILGNIISLLGYFAPLPTFYHIYRKKSTEGFQSLPYVVALLSSLLWFTYALLTIDGFLLLTINSVGSVIEFIYIMVYIVYATKESRNLTLKLFLSLSLGLFLLFVLLTHFIVEGMYRYKVLGWICAVVSIGVFAAPLGTLVQVIRTKSVEFMPFTLSVFLMLNAITWFFYGFCKKDMFVAIPNVVGFIFGMLQMILYAIYMKKASNVTQEKFQECVITIVPLTTTEVPPKDVQPNGGDDVMDKSVPRMNNKECTQFGRI